MRFKLHVEHAVQQLVRCGDGAEMQPPVVQVNEEWLGHVEVLHAKLDFVKGSLTVQVRIWEIWQD